MNWQQQNKARDAINHLYERGGVKSVQDHTNSLQSHNIIKKSTAPPPVSYRVLAIVNLILVILNVTVVGICIAMFVRLYRMFSTGDAMDSTKSIITETGNSLNNIITSSLNKFGSEGGNYIIESGNKVYQRFSNNDSSPLTDKDLNSECS